MKALIINKILLLWLLFFSSYSLCAQEYSIGIKGGVNSSFNKKSAEIVGNAGSFSTDARPGLQAGAFFELKFQEFFLRPEIFFSRARGEFPFPNAPSLYTIDKISVPLLIGRNIFKELDVYAGPAYQYFLNTELENATQTNSSEAPENQQLNLATQVGMKYGFRSLELDLRFDFTFDSKRNQRIDIPGLMNNAFFDDGRLHQLMLSVNWKLFDSEHPRRPRSRRSCYF